MNNFKDYGFEADFEGEICFQSESYYIGYIVDNGKKLPRYWNKNLTCFNPLTTNFECAELTNDNHKYNLKPIKKEWYKNPDNFPCLVYMEDKRDEEDKGYYTVLGNMNSYKSEFLIANIIRPATEEEVLALLVKE